MRPKTRVAGGRAGALIVAATSVRLVCVAFDGPVSVLFLIAASAFGLAWSGIASHADPLRSPACLDALDALRAREAVVAPARSPDPRLLALRQRAAAVCLGAHDDAPVASGRAAQPPLSTTEAVRAPVVIAIPVPAAVRPPALAIPALPLTTLQCDAVGCTASDGSRLNRMGPNLWGVGGACIALGPVLQCP